MPTLKATRQRCLALEPELLGRVESIATIAAQYVTVSNLAYGTVTAAKLGQQWMLRPETATAADRLRLATAQGFDSSLGKLTHAGAGYLDITATAETIELHAHEPRLLETCINEAARQIRRIDTQYFQARPDGRYPIAGAFSWLDEPSLIVRFGRRGIPVLTPNRHMESWGTVHTDGTLRPDSFTLANGTFARSTTARRGQYSLSVTRSGTDSTVDVVIPVVFDDAAGDNLRAKTFMGALVARSAQANSARVRVTSEDASGTVLSTSNSSYHAGGGAWGEVTVAHTIHAAAEQVRVQGRLEVNETALFDELYGALVPAQTDDIRRDQKGVDWIERPYDYEQNPLMWLGPDGIGEQLVMESRRAYPTFDATRLAAGTADLDVTDCPLDLLAHKALALFFDARKTKSKQMAALAQQYGDKADVLQRQHLYEQTKSPQAAAPMMSGVQFGRRAVIA